MRSRKKIPTHKYKPAYKWFRVNYDDKDVRPIYISLPKPPPIKLIDGYGLEPEDQVFSKLKIPYRLKMFEQKVYRYMQDWSDKNKNHALTGYKIIKQFWKQLTEEQEDYEEEITFIKNVIWYSIHGYWCFIKGRPVYLPPSYFCFLNFWKWSDPEDPESIYPEFRFDDLCSELFKHYLYKTHETFKHLDENGNAIKVNGKYEMIELGNRTFFGSMKPKRRRCGESHRALNNIMWIVVRGLGRTGTIIADKGKNTEKHFKKRLVPAWQEWPIWLKPIWDGDNNPSTKISFVAPSNAYNEKSLKSIIDITTSAEERANDSDKIHAMLCDEEGKTERADINTRWGVNKLTMAQGLNIHGYSEHPSTVEEMNEGGEIFFNMWEESNFYNRDRLSGQTKSGLGREYVPAYRAYDKFIDKWGYSVIDKPTEEQIKYAPRGNSYVAMGIGAKEAILRKRERYLKSGKQEDIKTYRELRRREPVESSECWMGTSGDIGFPVEEIDKRLASLRHEDYRGTTKGNFEWVGGVQDGSVEFIKDEYNGRFLVSLLLDRDNIYKSNQFTTTQMWYGKTQSVKQMWMPLNTTIFTAGADPYAFLDKEPDKVTQTVLSDGGLCVFWEKESNRQIDPDGNRSYRFVLTYRYRHPNFYDYAEDCIKACRYYGAMMFFERNKERLWEYFLDRGYGGYLKYAYDVKTNTFKDAPGAYSGLESKNNLFNSVRDYLDKRCHVEQHYDFLHECKDIKNPRKLNKFDLLAACGWALEGSKSTYGQLVDVNRLSENAIDIHGSYLEPHSY